MSYELGFPLQSEPMDNSTVAMAMGATTACLIFTHMMTAMCAAPSNEEPVVTIAEESSLSDADPPKQTADLVAPVLSALSVGGMSAKDLLKQLKVDHPEITKRDVNSNLYKLLTKKAVKKDASACPIWTMV